MLWEANLPIPRKRDAPRGLEPTRQGQYRTGHRADRAAYSIVNDEVLNTRPVQNVGEFRRAHKRQVQEHTRLTYAQAFVHQ